MNQQNHFKKKNGFTNPFNLQQILTDTAFVYLIIIYFIIIFPIQTFMQKIVFTSLYVISMIIVVMEGIFTTIRDPTDISIRKQYDQEFKNSEQFKIVYKHDEFIKYCSYCCKEVHVSTKHCHTCNRCCQHFDHHCKYLNNCVGWNNYRHFLYLITFLFLFITIQLIITCIKINQYIYRQTDYVNTINNAIFKLNSVNYNILVVVTSTPLLIIFLLIIPLIVFHIFLNINNLTTFEYFAQKKRSDNKLQIHNQTNQKSHTVEIKHQMSFNTQYNIKVPNNLDSMSIK